MSTFKEFIGDRRFRYKKDMNKQFFGHMKVFFGFQALLTFFRISWLRQFGQLFWTTQPRRHLLWNSWPQFVVTHSETDSSRTSRHIEHVLSSEVRDLPRLKSLMISAGSVKLSSIQLSLSKIKVHFWTGLSIFYCLRISHWFWRVFPAKTNLPW